ncbi:fungal-specific transcription factor domain-containing protein [Aspergillus ambiguus]|uniref:putative C6 transcription factor Prf n=1 Tax=Aspergillus ambiguus TaxID=176160 RepID=UPI003CCDFE55
MADFFNNPSQPPPSQNSSQLRPTPTDTNPPTASVSAGHPDAADGSTYIPRMKRIACVVCRRRKLRCDGKRPSCGTCSRLGHECAYDEVRKKSGPKRGYVKQLEARLAQVETLLKTQEQPLPSQGNNFAAAPDDSTNLPDLPTLPNDIDEPPSPAATGAINPNQGTQMFLPPAVDHTGTFGWDMISLGLEEPLPTREVIDELNHIYFEKIHPSQPFIHRPRHMASMDLTPNIRPPVCLQYMTWCHAASVSEKYSNLHGLFYQRARKYAELDEMKGLGEGVVSLAHCQTWLLISSYEFRMMFFPRAWLSGGKASRLALMLGLNRVDGAALEVKQSLAPPKDWTEKEERRRVFWMAFCIDRYASVGTGWPVLFDERDITTNLPASEEAFVQGQPQRTSRFEDIIVGDGLSTLSPFGGVVIMAVLFGRHLAHLHRPESQDNDHDLNGGYWQRHRSYDNVLLHFALAMPSHLRLPAGILDPNVIFCNMAIHTSTVCLHQAAIFKAEKNKMPAQIIIESKRRCIVAADQISNIMKMISHLDLTTMNPFMSFCVFIAARVFVQYLKSRPEDTAARSSLQFIFSALDALKGKNPLTESFLVQLDVDIEGTSLRDLRPTRSSTAITTQKDDPSYIKVIGNCNLHKVQEATGSYASQLHQHQHQAAAPTPHSSLPSRQKQKQPSPNSFHLDSNTTASSSSTVSDFARQQQSYHPSHPPQTTATGTVIADMDMAPEYTADPSSTTDPTSASASTSAFLESTSQKPPPLENPASIDQLPLGSAIDPYMDIPLSARVLPTGIVTPLDSTASDGSIPLPPSWDFSAPAAPTTGQTPNDGEDLDLSAAGIETFTEAQWAQILGSGWDTWRNQGGHL